MKLIIIYLVGCPLSEKHLHQKTCHKCCWVWCIWTVVVNFLKCTLHLANIWEHRKFPGPSLHSKPWNKLSKYWNEYIFIVDILKQRKRWYRLYYVLRRQWFCCTRWKIDDAEPEDMCGYIELFSTFTYSRKKETGETAKKRFNLYKI